MILPQKQWRGEKRASHVLYLDTPPLKGLRLEPFGSIRNHCEESMRCAFPGSTRNRSFLHEIGEKDDKQHSR
jgi:hypothetical protein